MLNVLVSVYFVHSREAGVGKVYVIEQLYFTIHSNTALLYIHLPVLSDV